MPAFYAGNDVVDDLMRCLDDFVVQAENFA